MTTLLAILESRDYGFIAVIVMMFAGAAIVRAPRRADLRRLERKLDALLKHQGVGWPLGVSPEVQQMAKDPKQKIAAIKLYMEENPGVGLLEAKEKIEGICKGSQNS